MTRGVLMDIPRLKASTIWRRARRFIPKTSTPGKRSPPQVEAAMWSSFARALGLTGRKRSWPASKSSAGLDVTCAKWLKSRDVAMLGSDAASDVMPSGIDGVAQPIHTLVLVAMGMPIFDNCDLELLGGSQPQAALGIPADGGARLRSPARRLRAEPDSNLLNRGRRKVRKSNHLAKGAKTQKRTRLFFFASLRLGETCFFVTLSGLAAGFRCLGYACTGPIAHGHDQPRPAIPHVRRDPARFGRGVRQVMVDPARLPASLKDFERRQNQPSVRCEVTPVKRLWIMDFAWSVCGPRALISIQALVTG